MRWNSIVVKMGLTIMLLLLLILLPLGYTVNQIFTGFYFKQVQEELTSLSSRYSESLSSLEDQNLLTVFELLGNLTDHQIIVFNEKGIVVSNSGANLYSKGIQVDSEILADLFTNGHAQGVRGSDSPNRYYLVGKPISNNDQVIGGLIVLTSVEGIYDSLEQIQNLVTLAGVGSILLAMGFTFIISRKLTNPLIEIERATKKISKGDFTIRMKAGSKDEIGSLVMAINDMAQELDRIQNTRTEFFANISHELRTPITYLEGFTRAIKEKRYKSEQERDEYITILEEEAKRLSKLINDLFELSKMKEGKFDLYQEEISLNKVLQNSLAKVKLSAEQKGLEVRHMLASDDLIIVADRSRLEQVLLNLLENAIRYTNRGSIALSLKELNHQAIISIQDTGVGIPEQDLPYVFDRFYRVDKSRTRKLGGTGLGLAIVKELVELQNGTIDIKSKVGEGTAIHLIFPLYREEEQIEES
ncbi:sensor histidine kinase [Bacillus salitolerans]|uniref:histidine kinase n=1 Tax=Bacillus salitolerans TaxID=1437434 RepID=A0ABW4LPW6_9BACI